RPGNLSMFRCMAGRRKPSPCDSLKSAGQIFKISIVPFPILREGRVRERFSVSAFTLTSFLSRRGRGGKRPLAEIGDSLSETLDSPDGARRLSVHPGYRELVCSRTHEAPDRPRCHQQQ